MTSNRASESARKRWAGADPDARRDATRAALTASAVTRERRASVDALTVEVARRAQAGR